MRGVYGAKNEGWLDKSLAAAKSGEEQRTDAANPQSPMPAGDDVTRTLSYYCDRNAKRINEKGVVS
jgi:hypothetical protein